MFSKKPFLLGVEHIPANLNKTVKALLSLGVKRVGIEADRQVISAARKDLVDPTTIYWNLLAHHLREKGIIVVPLISPQVIKRLEQLPNANILDWKWELTNKVLEDPDLIFIAHELTEEIAKEANHTKVDAITTGTWHAMLLRKDLKIPKERCFTVSQHLNPTPLRRLLSKTGLKRFQIDTRQLKDLLKGVRVTRRYQHHQRRLGRNP